MGKIYKGCRPLIIVGLMMAGLLASCRCWRLGRQRCLSLGIGFPLQCSNSNRQPALAQATVMAPSLTTHNKLDALLPLA